MATHKVSDDMARRRGLARVAAESSERAARAAHSAKATIPGRLMKLVALVAGAASLVLGILAGQSRLVTSATDLLAGASQTTNDSGAQLAFTDDIDGLADEDLL